MKAQYTNYILITFFFLIIGTATGKGQNPVKIMPIGNSITKGETDGSITDDNLLKGYRFDLKQLLQTAGYNTDFVGSESAGCSYFTDCQHAGIGGTRDQFVVRLLTDGYDERNGVQILVPPRPYLDEYNPDIILLHIGTNDLTHEDDAITNQQVSAILDIIDQYETRANKEVIVFLALIINRKLPDYPGSGIGTTSDWNNTIKQMALARIASGDKIIIVDMEHDAGFVYNDTDMSDLLHPNANGYLKMATLWKSSIVNNYNTAPEISPIPDQNFDEGGVSGTISLDTYITDIQDSDQDITWSITQLGTPNLNITQDINRQVTATPIDNEWNGTQTVAFTATDKGKNGKYIKSVTDTVVFTVKAVNDAPIITSNPSLSIDQGQLYTYSVVASDIDVGDTLQYSTLIKPDWLIFYPDSKLFAGVAQPSGSYPVTIRVTDGHANADQSFNIMVIGPSAVNKSESDEYFSIFPNPASDYVTIQLKKSSQDVEFKLLDIAGVPVIHKLIEGTNEIIIDLNKEYIDSGVYFYKIILSGELFTGKLLIRK